ncbi:MAG: hypothetical protein A2808_00025 [Candidatus Moranbacteria bacterium RIFCSPHIGHO2_01_FULL_55_24]|nr:MAG: hypothetical protein A2808_00025 [Candidatus Moranbacteria bacterium RIFCSPHIGHO2_01_FULL_55_24]
MIVLSQAYFRAFVIGLIAALAEFFGSYISGSISLLGDAFHIGFDTVGYLIGWFSIALMLRVPGRRFQALMGIFLVLASANILYQAVERFQTGGAVITNTLWFFVIGIFGLAANAVTLLILRVPHNHGHLQHEHEEHGAHAHSHDAILSANILHTVSDFACSVLVVLTALSHLVFPETRFLALVDPAVSLVIASFLLIQAYRLLTT